MKAKLPTQKRLNKTVIAALTLMLGAIGLLLYSPGSQAQQEPNRQLVQTGSTNTNASKRIALVIGNGAYTNAPPLKNPPNDARDMAATLRALGFDVTNGINVNQRDMKRLIREFGQKLKAGGSGLFYYAGHGVQSKGRSSLNVLRSWETRPDRGAVGEQRGVVQFGEEGDQLHSGQGGSDCSCNDHADDRFPASPIVDQSANRRVEGQHEPEVESGLGVPGEELQGHHHGQACKGEPAPGAKPHLDARKRPREDGCHRGLRVAKPVDHE